MNRPRAALQLVIRFPVEAVVSGWSTARIILFGSHQLHPGWARLPYGELPDSAAALLGALITLTPGTTVVDIDPERREMLVHLLDHRQAEATLATIRRDFLGPLRVLFGARP